VETVPPALLFVDTGLVDAGVKLAESVIKEAGIKLEQGKASEGAGGGGKLKIVPHTVRHLSFGDIQEDNVSGIYDGPFPWENAFGFHLAGMVGHDFFSRSKEVQKIRLRRNALTVFEIALLDHALVGLFGTLDPIDKLTAAAWKLTNYLIRTLGCRAEKKPAGELNLLADAEPVRRHGISIV
jgi:hypothetical protein